MKGNDNPKVLNLRMLYKGVVLDDRTKEYVVKRVEKMEKITKKALEYEVEVERDKKGKFRVEIMVKTPRSLYRGEETSESVEGSVDMVVDQLQSQIIKNFEKFRDLRLRGARSIKKKAVISQSARF